MTEREIIGGQVEQINPWKTGKGYFLVIAGDDTDYYGYGPAKMDPGEQVELEVEPGKGNFSDKVLITKKLGKAQGPAKQTPPLVQAQKKTEEAAAGVIQNMIDKNSSIVQQCCLKAAANMVSELHPRNKTVNWDKLAETTLRLKQKFFLNMMGLEPEKKGSPKEKAGEEGE